jgi:hypothetical protein
VWENRVLRRIVGIIVEWRKLHFRQVFYGLIRFYGVRVSVGLSLVGLAMRNIPILLMGTEIH